MPLYYPITTPTIKYKIKIKEIIKINGKILSINFYNKPCKRLSPKINSLNKNVTNL